MQKYTKDYSTKKTSQRKPIPGKKQVKNNAGGYVFSVDDWKRLERFLILGTSGGTYYVGQSKLTVENAECVRRCIEHDGVRTVNTIVDISVDGRAPKNDPALFALAMCSHFGDLTTRREAFAALPEVARIGTHLFHFVEYREGFGGWGRGMRRAVASWYLNKPISKLAYQLIKYQQRDGWSHKDLLRLSHPKTKDEEYDNLFMYVVGKAEEETKLPPLVDAFEVTKVCTKKGPLIRLIKDFDLTREMVPTEFLKEPKVWEALLGKMPLTAMVRNLGNMSKIGLLKPLSNASNFIVDRLADEEYIQKSRVHPIQMLAALHTYGSGQSVRGSGVWKPVPQVVDALDEAFYLSFKNVEPTGKRFLLSLDVSGSMSWNGLDNIPGLTACMGAAAMSMVTARTESKYYTMGFANKFRDLKITAKDTIKSAVQKAQDGNFGRTDCALPMVWALENKIEVDVFVIYTDNETWTGRIHPTQALKQYRSMMGIDAKLIVCGMTATDFSIADPEDSGSLDVVGFDTVTPNVISQFAMS